MVRMRQKEGHVGVQGHYKSPRLKALLMLLLCYTSHYVLSAKWIISVERDNNRMKSLYFILSERTVAKEYYSPCIFNAFFG